MHDWLMVINSNGRYSTILYTIIYIQKQLFAMLMFNMPCCYKRTYIYEMIVSMSTILEVVMNLEYSLVQNLSVTYVHESGMF